MGPWAGEARLGPILEAGLREPGVSPRCRQTLAPSAVTGGLLRAGEGQPSCHAPSPRLSWGHGVLISLLEEISWLCFDVLQDAHEISGLQRPGISSLWPQLRGCLVCEGAGWWHASPRLPLTWKAAAERGQLSGLSVGSARGFASSRITGSCLTHDKGRCQGILPLLPLAMTNH